MLTGKITDAAGKNVKGTSKVTVKIDGKTLKTSNGKIKYYYVKDGKISIQLKDKNYRTGNHTVEVVSGPIKAYAGARKTTTLTVTKSIANKKAKA